VPKFQDNPPALLPTAEHQCLHGKLCLVLILLAYAFQSIFVSTPESQATRHLLKLLFSLAEGGFSQYRSNT